MDYDVSRDNRKNTIKKAYKKSISIYDEILVGRKWWSKLYLSVFWGGVNDLYIADELLCRIPINFKGKILDVPVGTGIFTANYYKDLKNSEIIGVDYSQEMLDRCGENMDENSVYIELLRQDVGDLKFNDNYFDMVISMNGFHAFPNKEKAYDNVLRVLKPGGKFYGCFYIQKELGLADLLVKKVLTPKGWFSPPFETKESLLARLEKDYDILWYTVNGSIISFECVKKPVKL